MDKKIIKCIIVLYGFKPRCKYSLRYGCVWKQLRLNRITVSFLHLYGLFMIKPAADRQISRNKRLNEILPIMLTVYD